MNERRGSLGDGKPFKGSSKQNFREINPALVCSKYINKIALIWILQIYVFGH